MCVLNISFSKHKGTIFVVIVNLSYIFLTFPIFLSFNNNCLVP